MGLRIAKKSDPTACGGKYSQTPLSVDKTTTRQRTGDQPIPQDQDYSGNPGTGSDHGSAARSRPANKIALASLRVVASASLL
jgi:hypothetical protein